MKPSRAQIRVLKAVAACSTPDSPADGWGDVFTHYDRANGTPLQFEMRNFDRSSDVCVRVGWLRYDKDEGISLTDKGRAASTILHESSISLLTGYRGCGTSST